MNSNGDSRQTHQNLPQEDTRITNAVSVHDITSPLDTHEFITINNITYVIVYTDGSAFNTHCRYLARAGWAVW